MFDYWCSDCKNYVLLEWNKDNGDMLNGWCALCGKKISMSYESYVDWKNNVGV